MSQITLDCIRFWVSHACAHSFRALTELQLPYTQQNSFGWESDLKIFVLKTCLTDKLPQNNRCPHRRGKMDFKFSSFKTGLAEVHNSQFSVVRLRYLYIRNYCCSSVEFSVLPCFQCQHLAVLCVTGFLAVRLGVCYCGSCKQSYGRLEICLNIINMISCKSALTGARECCKP